MEREIALHRSKLGMPQSGLGGPATVAIHIRQQVPGPAKPSNERAAGAEVTSSQLSQ